MTQRIDLGGPQHDLQRLRLSHLGNKFDWWRVIDMAGAILGSGFSLTEALERAEAELEWRATKTGSNDER